MKHLIRDVVDFCDVRSGHPRDTTGSAWIGRWWPVVDVSD